MGQHSLGPRRNFSTLQASNIVDRSKFEEPQMMSAEAMVDDLRQRDSIESSVKDVYAHPKNISLPPLQIRNT